MFGCRAKHFRCSLTRKHFDINVTDKTGARQQNYTYNPCSVGEQHSSFISNRCRYDIKHMAQTDIAIISEDNNDVSSRICRIYNTEKIVHPHQRHIARLHCICRPPLILRRMSLKTVLSTRHNGNFAQAIFHPDMASNKQTGL